MLLGVGDMISMSWTSYKKYFRSLTSFLLLSLFISTVLSLLLFIPFIIKTNFQGNFIPLFTWILAVLLALGIIYFLFQMLIGFELRLRQALHNEKHLSFQHTLHLAKPLVLKSIGVSLFTGLFTALPLLFAIVGLFGKNTPELLEAWFVGQNHSNLLPPILALGVAKYFFSLLFVYGIFHIFYFSIVFSMSFNSVIFDHKKIKEAIETSMDLIRGRWWGVWWRLFTPQIILLAIYGIFSLLTFALRTKLGAAVGDLSDITLAFFINFFVAIPLIYLPAIVLYEDLKKNLVKKK